jgi:FkbM family methyltransferase
MILEIQRSADRIAIVDHEGKRQIWISAAASVYTNDMVESFGYYHGAIVPFARAGYAIADYSAPHWHEIVGFPDFPVFCPSLAEPYETCRQYLEIAHLQPGETVLDLGGYSGLSAIAFSIAVGITGRVIVAEPDPVNLAACEKNIALHRRVNGLNNVHVVCGAMAGETGTISFSAESSTGSGAVDIVGRSRGKVVTVPAITLSDLTAELPRVDFIKCDIEGSEIAMLCGSRDFFVRHRPRMIIEAHAMPDGHVCADDVAAILIGYGYECAVIPQPGTAFPLVVATP